MKVCTTCKEEKQLNNFNKDSRAKDGIRSKCRECQKNYRKINREKILIQKKKYRENNKNKISAAGKKYRENNKDMISMKKKKYYEENKEKISENNKKYYENNKDEIAVRTKEYQENNKEKISIYKKEYRESHRDERNEYERNRNNTDPLYKLSNNIRKSIRHALKNKGYEKTSQTHEILGCSFTVLLEHLNDNLYGFDYTDEKIDVDHIIPLATATTEKEVIELNHYSNLQLLPSEYNRNIKRDNQFDVEDFENWLYNYYEII